MTDTPHACGRPSGLHRRRMLPAIVVAVGSVICLGALAVTKEPAASGTGSVAQGQSTVSARLAMEPEAARALARRLAKNDSQPAADKAKAVPALAKDVEKEKGTAPKSDAKTDETPTKPIDPGKTQQITFDTLKFEMEKTDPYDRDLIGEKIEGLVGRRIKIRGYMHPSSCFTQTVRKFVFVRDNMECCFGPGAALYDCIFVTMKPGKTTQYTTRPISVEGIFRIEEVPDPIEPDANPQAIYQMEGEAVD